MQVYRLIRRWFSGNSGNLQKDLPAAENVVGQGKAFLFFLMRAHLRHVRSYTRHLSPAIANEAQLVNYSAKRGCNT